VALVEVVVVVLVVVVVVVVVVSVVVGLLDPLHSRAKPGLWSGKEHLF